MKKCQNCSRNNLQKAEMVASAGKSSSVGVGGGTGGLGIGFAQTSSSLAKKAAFRPPRDGFLSDIQGFISLFISLAVIGLVWWGPIYFDPEDMEFSFFRIIGGLIAGGLTASALSSIGFSGNAEARLESAKEKYKHTWMCLDCGHLAVESYTPKAAIKAKAKAESAAKSKAWRKEKLESLKQTSADDVIKTGQAVAISVGGKVFRIVKWSTIIFFVFFVTVMVWVIFTGDRVGWVNTNTLNIRSEPSLGGEVVGAVKFGDRLTIKETTDGWKLIERGGWVNGKYVSATNPNPDAEQD